MRRSAPWIRLPVVLLACLASAPSARAVCSTEGLPTGRNVVELQTTAGELCIEMLSSPGEAPNHVENFLYYLVEGEIEGTLFSRFVPDFVMQGGQWKVGPDATELVPVREDFVVINEPCEPTLDIGNGAMICEERGNEAYTVALAKQEGDPDSGSSSWFINLEDNRDKLDEQNGGFTVFGRLIGAQSIETADRMAESVIAVNNDLFWSESRFGYDTIFVDDVEYILPRLTEVPLLEEAPWDSTDYSCLDMRSQATLLLEELLPNYALDPDDPDAPSPARHVVSAACGTPVADAATWIDQRGQGSVDCPEPDRLALLSSTPRPLSALDGELIPVITTFPELRFVSLTCEQVRESDLQRAAWRDDFRDLLIEIQSATVRVAVPEPGGVAGAAGALACLGWLKRRRRA